MPLDEVYEAVDLVKEVVDETGNIIFGAAIDEAMNDEVEITIIATGFKGTPDEEPEVEKAREDVQAYGSFDKEKYDQYVQKNETNALGLGVRRVVEEKRPEPVVEEDEEPVQTQTSRISSREADIPPFLRKIKKDR